MDIPKTPNSKPYRETPSNMDAILKKYENLYPTMPGASIENRYDSFISFMQEVYAGMKPPELRGKEKEMEKDLQTVMSLHKNSKL